VKDIVKSRDIIFISKATPGDDEFVLWLAPRLEAEGYKVFADILTLEPGGRWRKNITSTLQNNAIKMLLCCRDETLDKNGVQEEIAIAEDLSKELDDEKFIIPLRLKPYKKLFGIGGLQYINFVGSWANGLHEILEAFEKKNVPKNNNITINPNWEAYKSRQALKVEKANETLTTNWIRIVEIPDEIHYYMPTGSIDHSVLKSTCNECEYPVKIHNRGIITFAELEEINDTLSNIGKFKHHSSYPVMEFVREGSDVLKIKYRDASNIISSMFRQCWDNFCQNKKLIKHMYSKHSGWHCGPEQIDLRKKVSWGPSEYRRSSMLRNIAKGKTWQFGITSYPSLWPFPHYRLKSRVLFADEAGTVLNDTKLQHKSRRTVCSTWRNKQWHGRLMAMLELLSENSPHISLPISPSCNIVLDTQPIEVVVPATTKLPDIMTDDDEESDSSTLGNINIDLDCAGDREESV